MLLFNFTILCWVSSLAEPWRGFESAFCESRTHLSFTSLGNNCVRQFRLLLDLSSNQNFYCWPKFRQFCCQNWPCTKFSSHSVWRNGVACNPWRALRKRRQLDWCACSFNAWNLKSSEWTSVRLSPLARRSLANCDSVLRCRQWSAWIAGACSSCLGRLLRWCL